MKSGDLDMESIIDKTSEPREMTGCQETSFIRPGVYMVKSDEL